MMRLAALGLGTLLSITVMACDAGEHSSTQGTGGGSGGGSSGTTSGLGGSSGTTSGAGASSASTSGTSTSGASTTSTSSGGPTVNCTDVSTTAGAVNQQYGGVSLAANGGKTYYLQSNWWHSYMGEVENFNGLSFTVKNPNNASDSASDGNPMGFPSIFIGTYAGHTTSQSNLPKQVSALTSVPTIYESNSSAIGLGNHNATYDVWFTQSGSPLGPQASSPGTGGAYLMVWMFKPTNRQPRGNDSGRTGQTVAGVPGTWDVWVDMSTNPPCTSYVSSNPIDGLQFDLNDFIKDAVTKNYGVTNSMYLSVVFGGFEIWGGNDGLELKQFCASVN